MAKPHGRKEMYYIFSPFLRIFHWVMFGTVMVLFATGLYIGDPAFGALPGREPTFVVGDLFSMETVRKVHFIAAALLLVSLIIRVYGFIINRGDRLFPHFWKKSFWSDMWYQFKHYLMVPSDEERIFLRNPLARTSYTLVYVMLFLLALTGLAMYSQINPNTPLAFIFNPINGFLTEYGSHYIHHILAWLVILFAIIHVYMVWRAERTERNGELSSMLSGVKFFDELPKDFGDIANEESEVVVAETTEGEKVLVEPIREPLDAEARS